MYDMFKLLIVDIITKDQLFNTWELPITNNQLVGSWLFEYSST
jgi:hypothetical protein